FPAAHALSAPMILMFHCVPSAKYVAPAGLLWGRARTSFASRARPDIFESHLMYRSLPAAATRLLDLSVVSASRESPPTNAMPMLSQRFVTTPPNELTTASPAADR